MTFNLFTQFQIAAIEDLLPTIFIDSVGEGDEAHLIHNIDEQNSIIIYSAPNNSAYVIIKTPDNIYTLFAPEQNSIPLDEESDLVSGYLAAKALASSLVSFYIPNTSIDQVIKNFNFEPFKQDT